VRFLSNSGDTFPFFLPSHEENCSLSPGAELASLISFAEEFDIARTEGDFFSLSPEEYCRSPQRCER